MKIGQEIMVKEDFKINTMVSDKVKTVKKGDKGFMDSRGFLHLTTGNGIGKIVKIDDIEVKGYDHRNIASIIFRKLIDVYDLDEFIYYEGFEEAEIIDDIADVLMEIL